MGSKTKLDSILVPRRRQPLCRLRAWRSGVVRLCHRGSWRGVVSLTINGCRRLCGETPCHRRAFHAREFTPSQPLRLSLLVGAWRSVNVRAAERSCFTASKEMTLDRFSGRLHPSNLPRPCSSFRRPVDTRSRFLTLPHAHGRTHAGSRSHHLPRVLRQIFQSTTGQKIVAVAVRLSCFAIGRTLVKKWL